MYKNAIDRIFSRVLYILYNMYNRYFNVREITDDCPIHRVLIQQF